MRVRTTAPAKINWTLEVLGRRPDGYHEIRSVMQTIELCDEVELLTKGESGGNEGASRVSTGLGAVTLAVEGMHEATKDDLALRAARTLEEATGRELPAVIRLLKRIPPAAGLGGGSSDAAAVLRGLAMLHQLDVPAADLSAIAARIGSDVPFFLNGGTALVSGRGESVERLPGIIDAWLVVLAPPFWMADKTRRMYAALEGLDFTDGRRTELLAQRLRQGDRISFQDACNAFERAAYASFRGLSAYRDGLLSAGAEVVHLAGAGPSLFVVFDSREEAEGLAERFGGTEGRVFVARTVGAGQATRVEM